MGLQPRKTSIQVIEKALRNEDLPNLRADHVVTLVSETEPRPVILDNSPARTVADMDRTVEIILFMPW